jgi:hypothetical protein
MKQITLVSLSLFSALIPSGLAQNNVWLIDDSCFGGPQGSVTAFVQRGMNGAFNLAQKGLEVAQDAANDQNKQRLIDRLFGTADYNGAAPRDEVARILTQVLTYKTEVQNKDGIEEGRGDIVRRPDIILSLQSAEVLTTFIESILRRVSSRTSRKWGC